MKKIVFTLALILAFTTNGISQDKKREASEKMSVEQRNQLQLKKMTLDLDLSTAQQKEVATLIAEQSAKREAKIAERKGKKDAKKTLTADEKFELKNKMLDEKMVMKAKMNKILNKEQMEKWEANKGKREAHGQKMRKQHKQKTHTEVSE